MELLPFSDGSWKALEVRLLMIDMKEGLNVISRRFLDSDASGLWMDCDDFVKD